MPTLNWTYGAKSPDIEQAVSDAVFAAHQYRNKLCELELAKRSRHEELLQRLAPEYVEACKAVEVVESQLAEAREAIQAERKKQRTKTPAGCEKYAEAAKQCKAELKKLRAARKSAKKAAYDDPEVAAAMEDNQRTHRDAQAAAKAESGLYWGTEAIVKAACNSFSSGAPPRFKRFNGEGQLAVQLQKGLDCRDAFGDDTRLQLVVSDELQEELLMRGKAPRSRRKAECLIRIGSEGRDPIFARVPIVFHRPLPEGKIKWAYLERRKLADKVKWKVRLTIDVERKLEPITKPAVAVHVGWRMDDDDLRVATWLGEDGKRGVLKLPDRHLDDYVKLDTVKSRRDSGFNKIKSRLAEWLSKRESEWLREATKNLHQWRSPARLASLYWRWKESGEELFGPLNEWRKRDKLLWQHERRLSVRIVRRRKDWYREFVARLKHDYDVAFIAPIPAKELVEHSTPEELERDQNARRAKQAAVSDLLVLVREKFGVRCVETEAKGITQTCSECGYDNPAPKRKVQCGQCHATYDRDENAVANTLARGRVAVESGALLANQKAQEVAAKKREEKLRKMQEANRAARKRKREPVS